MDDEVVRKAYEEEIDALTKQQHFQLVNTLLAFTNSIGSNLSVPSEDVINNLSDANEMTFSKMW